MNKKKCPFCAEEIDEDALQCPLCGATLSSLSESKAVAEKKCPFCSEMIDGDASKCPECDSVLGSLSSGQSVALQRDSHARDADFTPGDSADWSFDSRIALCSSLGGLLLSLLPWPFWLKVVFTLVSLLGGGFGIYILKKMTPEEKRESFWKIGTKFKSVIAVVCAIVLIALNVLAICIAVSEAQESRSSQEYLDEVQRVMKKYEDNPCSEEATRELNKVNEKYLF